MTFVTDPDDLDRWQVAIDPTNETVSVRGLGASRVYKEVTGSGSIGQTFDDVVNGDFVASGVAQGDTLIITSGDYLIGHYTVSGSVTATSFAVYPSFPAAEEGLTYRVAISTAADGPSGGNVGDGVSKQSLYSFLKEEWHTLSDPNMPDLIKFTFPYESITREQFELGGASHSDWDYADDTTRNLIRTGGWQKQNGSGTRMADYTGVITLGSLDSDAQVYYLQTQGGTPTDFVLTGAVNQSVKTYTNGGSDYTGFLKLFVRKKGKTYGQSEIADIGVTTIETIVNRFPLAHTDDAAISKSDGELIGETPFQSVADVDTQSTGVTADADTTDGVFEFTDVTNGDFQNDNLQPKDTVEITSVTDQGTYEIVSVNSATALTLRQEPGVTIVGGSSLSYTTRTRVRSQEFTDATLTDVDGDTGTLYSAASDFVTDGVQTGDMVQITAGTAGVIGTYKVVSVTDLNTLVLNTEDQVFGGQTNQTGLVLRAGMHLQYLSTDASQVSGVNITFNDDGGSGKGTIFRSGGNFISDGYVHGMAVTVVGATNAANNGTFVVDTVATDTLTLIASETLVDEGPAAGITIDGEVGFVRTLNNVDYPFNWRMFGNGGTLAECFQFVQKELRRTTDIDDGNGTSRGDITDLLMQFSTPTGKGLNMFIDNLSSSDLNNATFQDLSGDDRNFAFIAGVTVTLNSNITTDADAKVVIFFSDADGTPTNGDEFDTTGAIIVKDVDNNDMQDSTPLSSPLSFNFDYDNNAQGGRTPGTNAAVTIVCIGKDKAQYVKVTGTIQRQNENIFALVAALERNYSNP